MRFLIILIFLSFSPGVIAQEENVPPEEQKFPEGVTRSVYRVIEPIPQEVKESRIEPPFWWTGMKNTQVELLIHDQDIAFFYPSIDYPGINVVEVSRVANPNYLFITLNISTDASPGEFLITLVREGSDKVFRYELKPRNTDRERIDPINPGDLIYLVMPDRFSNGDPSNDSFDDMTQTGIDRSKMFFRHGGDLKGIINHLDYIQDLGATALWLNPVQENDQPYESYHGYAITDHYNVDKRFGDNELYKTLVDECQKRGMKVIMDVVYNHVGDHHWFIKDLPAFDWIHQFTEFKRTTYRAPTLMDPYASYYDKMMMADGWFDYHMPDLNQQNEKLATYLIQNSIWWIEYAGIDGYRVDTYAYPDQDFMGQWVKAIEEEYPDFHMYAETWVHGTPVQAYFADNAMELASNTSPIEAVTDFQLYYAIKEALTEEQGWTSGAARIYYTLANDYMYKAPFQNVIFLDNHDLSRFFSEVEEDLERFKSGITFLMTTRGIPMLYYGTEILLKNFTDPDGKVRQDFPGGWPSDTINKFKMANLEGEELNAYKYVKRLANYRKGHSVLQTGKLVQFVPEDGVYVYFRYDQKETIMVVLNTDNKDQNLKLDRFIEILHAFNKGRDVMTLQEHPLEGALRLKPYQSLVLELE